MRARAMLVPLLLLVSMLAGCATVPGTITVTQTKDPCRSYTDDSGRVVDPDLSKCGSHRKAHPAGKREPVAIDASGDLSGGLPAKTWTWNVDPNFTTFEVRLVLTGTGGATQWVAYGLQYDLAGGDNQTTIVSSGDPSTTSVTSQGSGCIVCYTGDPEGELDPVGGWRLTFGAQAATATYTLHVAVSY